MHKEIKTEEDVMEALDSLLLDDFSVYGDDAGLFAKMQGAISARTGSVITPMKYVNVLSVLPDEQQPKDGRIAIYEFGPEGIGETYFNMNLACGNLSCPDEEPMKAQEAADLRRNTLNGMAALMVPEAGFAKTVDGKHYDNREIIDELKHDRLMFALGGSKIHNTGGRRDRTGQKTYIVSPIALPTLGQRIDFKGRAIMEPSVERDAFLAKKLDSPKNIQLITKRSNGLIKVFMVASENYRPLPMTAMKDIYESFGSEESLGEMRCDGWEIDHSISRIRFVFRDYEKIQDVAYLYGLSDAELPTPGVEIISSDIGDCAFTVRGFWRLKKGILYTDEVAQKHTGDVDVEELTENVRREIFGKYTMLPDRFMELLGIDITPASVTNALLARDAAAKALADAKANHADKAVIDAAELANEKAARAAKKQMSDNNALMEALVKRIMKEINTTSISCKNSWLSRIKEQVLDQETPFTAYDVMSIILDTQELEKSDETVEKMRKSMTRLPYLDYAKFRDSIIEKYALFEVKPERRGRPKKVQDDQPEQPEAAGASGRAEQAAPVKPTESKEGKKPENGGKPPKSATRA